MKKLLYEDTLVLFAGHSCIVKNKPDLVDTSVLSKILGEREYTDINKFGLFSDSTPNYYTYYPDAKPEDFTPKEEDYIKPVFRLLSKTIVNPKTFPTDFSEGNVLKDSMHMLIGQSIFIDHETVTGNVQGVVADTFWQDKKVLADGKVIPAGINGVLKIDAKANPRTARAINMDPPAIHSDSVSIRFLWKKSHENLSDDEFRRRLGTMESGKLVRRIVTDIKSYSELSLVPHGADPFAKKIGADGNIVNPQMALSSFRLGQDVPNKSTIPLIIYNFKDLSYENFSESNNNNNNKMEQELQDALNKIKVKDEEIVTLSTKVGSLESQVADLTGELTLAQSFEGKSKKWDDALELKRQSVIGNYKALNVGKEDATIVEKLTNASEDVLDIYAETYSQKLEEAFPMECSHCHSLELTRRTSKEDDGSKGDGKVVTRSNKEAIDEYKKRKNQSK